MKGYTFHGGNLRIDAVYVDSWGAASSHYGWRMDANIPDFHGMRLTLSGTFASIDSGFEELEKQYQRAEKEYKAAQKAAP